jgi:hypothetical protein
LCSDFSVDNFQEIGYKILLECVVAGEIWFRPPRVISSRHQAKLETGSLSERLMHEIISAFDIDPVGQFSAKFPLVK